MPNLYQENCSYTPLAIGTNTVNPGPPINANGNVAPTPAIPSVFYGIAVNGLGTNTTTGTGTGGQPVTFAAYDIIAPTGLGTNTATVTNLLLLSTESAAGNLSAALPGLGVRIRGALVVVTSGPTTLGSCSCLWD